MPILQAIKFRNDDYLYLYLPAVIDTWTQLGSFNKKKQESNLGQCFIFFWKIYLVKSIKVECDLYCHLNYEDPEIPSSSYFC